MPKNKGRGGKNYKRGKNENETKRELLFAEDGESYAQVLKMLGNERVQVQTIPDNKIRMGLIRGKLRKKVWIMQNDIVLCGLWDFQEDQCHVLHKYTPDEVRQLIKHKEIPESIKVNEQQGIKESVGVDFVDEEGDSDENDDKEKNNNVSELQNKNQLRYMKDVDSSSSDSEEDQAQVKVETQNKTQPEKQIQDKKQTQHTNYKPQSQVHQQKEYDTSDI